MRKRSAAVTLGALFAASSLVGCSEREPDFYGVCVEESTELRVDDDRCPENGGNGFVWFYYPATARVPAVGERINTTHGSFTRPSTGRISTVSRGGFGGRAAGGSGS